MNQSSRCTSFLKFSTAKLFVIGVIGRLASQIAGQSLSDLFAWRVGEQSFTDTWRTSLVSRWEPFVEAVMPVIVAQMKGMPKR